MFAKGDGGENVREGTFAKGEGGENVREGTFAKGDGGKNVREGECSRGATFRATVHTRYVDLSGSDAASLRV